MPDFSKNKFISPRRVGLKPTAADRLIAELDTKLTQQQKQTILASAFNGKLI
ncbi:MAG: hypothetical protein GW843_01970 [Thiomicrospira sp.]|nr:hypothetical protein [Thiomicrospira sp.]NCN66893.1 hypothetical protein [Thiomicrospira sp.]NCO12743.1 hypothetical protein [Thiomicrospira sp.]NCO81065.1 hypothetical protein [Thiomicrospira sp.]NCP56518.1 hypothetical protein [Thiomicrospira sp.]